MSERSGRGRFGSWVLALVVATAACSSSPTAKTGTAGVSGIAGTSGSAGAGGGITGSAGSQTVGTQGGTVSQSGVSLTIPSDALGASTAISVGTTTAPAGFDIASAAYQFGPAGTTFAHPVTVTNPMTTTDPSFHLFWSNANGGFDDLGGTVTGMTLTGQVSHFSIGFCARPKADAGASDAATDAPPTAIRRGERGRRGWRARRRRRRRRADRAAQRRRPEVTGKPTPARRAAARDRTRARARPGRRRGRREASDGRRGAPADAGTGVDPRGALLQGARLSNLPFAAVTSTDAGALPDGATYGGGTPVTGKYYLTGIGRALRGGGGMCGLEAGALPRSTPPRRRCRSPRSWASSASPTVEQRRPTRCMGTVVREHRARRRARRRRSAGVLHGDRRRRSRCTRSARRTS